MEEFEIDSIGNDREWDGAANVFANKILLVRSAENLESAAFRDTFFESPELGVALVVEETIFKRRFEALVLHELVLEIDAGAIQHQGEIAVLIEEELRENEVQDVNGIVMIARENFGDIFLHRRDGPVRDGGWEWIEQAFWEEAFPFRMIEGKDINPVTESGKDIAGVRAFAVLGQGEEIDTVIGSETFEEMIGAMISAAVQGPGNIRINSENFHQLKIFQIDS